MTKPVATEFDLPADYDLEKRWKVYNRRTSITSWVVIIAFMLGGWTADFLYIAGIAITFATTDSFWLMIPVPLLFVAGGFASWRGTDWLLDQASRNRDEWSKMFAFRFAVADWEDNNLETRAAYWHQKSGKSLGLGLKQFFLARGCDVEELETDDHQRIDLIVSIANTRFYCICDGRYDGASFDMTREAIQLAAQRGCYPVVFHRGYWWRDRARTRQMGCALLSPGQIARNAASNSFHVPVKHRSRIGRILNFRERPESLARWPVTAEKG